MARDMGVPSLGLAKPRTPAAWASLLALPAILILTAVVYSPALDDGFVFHDFIHIGAAATTPAGEYVERILDPADGGESLFDTGRLYRPVFYMTFLVNHRLFGLDPFPYHVLSLCLHLLVVVCVWAFAQRLTQNAIASCVAAVIYGIHPIYVDVPAWITLINELLQALLFLAAVYLFAKSLEAKGRAGGLWLAGSVVAAALALANRETGASLFIIIPAYYFLVHRPQDWRRPAAWLQFAPFAVVLLAYALLRLAVLGNVAAGEGESGIGSLGWHMFVNMFKFNGWAIVPIFNQFSVWVTVVQGAAAILLLRASERCLVKGSGIERFLVVWWYASLLTYSTQATFLLGGRYMYTPMIAFVILLGLTVARVANFEFRRPWLVPAARVGLAGIMVVALVLATALTVRHERNFNDNAHESEAVLNQLEETYPTLPVGSTLYVVDAPESMLFGDTPLYLEPAVRMYYPDVASVRNVSQSQYEELAPTLGENDFVLFYEP